VAAQPGEQPVATAASVPVPPTIVPGVAAPPPTGAASPTCADPEWSIVLLHFNPSARTTGRISTAAAV